MTIEKLSYRSLEHLRRWNTEWWKGLTVNTIHQMNFDKPKPQPPKNQGVGRG